jgi:UDP-4-amino-4,6-dideoxy-N-acetyl-beta-L-altrosamine N-acetyltransferase
MSVTLRPLRRDDGDRVLQWRNSDAVAPYMYSDRQITAAEHAGWLEAALTAADRCYWIIALDGLPVGLANLARIDLQNRRCEWAYYLADPAVRGRGVGQAVEFAVLAHVFETRGLNKLWCEVFLDNTTVWQLHERFGFVREALFRSHVFRDGRPRDVVGLGMLASEWPQARAAALQRFADKGQQPASMLDG